ncbi:MAG: RNA 2'-phosphotransferase [Anaerolineales bacterium]|nr:RNA 2'-phosphotransferase [Anaerolineales bacterium]
MDRRQVQISKFLSLVLRHHPEKIGLTLDAAGWTAVSDLLAACNRHGFSLSLAELQAVVANNDKARFAFSPDGLRIRASQGHSIPVELGYRPLKPPDALFHGTAMRFLPSIQQQGLIKGRRHHVHLSPDIETARRVGQRHGPPIVLQVDSSLMHQDGYVFYRSDNGVWLIETVPPRYLSLVDIDGSNRTHSLS